MWQNHPINGEWAVHRQLLSHMTMTMTLVKAAGARLALISVTSTQAKKQLLNNTVLTWECRHHQPKSSYRPSTARYQSPGAWLCPCHRRYTCISRAGWSVDIKSGVTSLSLVRTVTTKMVIECATTTFYEELLNLLTDSQIQMWFVLCADTARRSKFERKAVGLCRELWQNHTYSTSHFYIFSTSMWESQQRFTGFL